MPDFQRLHEQYGDRLAMIGVNDGEDLATAAEFAGPNRTDVRYRILIDPSKSLTDGPYRLIGRPTTYYIDAGGIIRDIRVGEHDLETMRELAANLLGEEPAEQSAEEATGDYPADAATLLESITANFNAAQAEFARAAEDAALYDDPGLAPQRRRPSRHLAGTHRPLARAGTDDAIRRPPHRSEPPPQRHPHRRRPPSPKPWPPKTSPPQKPPSRPSKPPSPTTPEPPTTCPTSWKPRNEQREWRVGCPKRAISSAARASGLHPEGRRFDPSIAHHHPWPQLDKAVLVC